MTSDQVCSLPSFFSASGKDHPPEEHAEETYIGSYLDDSDMEQFVGFLSLQDVHTKQVYWTGCEFVVCFLISDSASVISSTSASPVRLGPRLLRPLPLQRAPGSGTRGSSARGGGTCGGSAGGRRSMTALEESNYFVVLNE